LVEIEREMLQLLTAIRGARNEYSFAIAIVRVRPANSSMGRVIVRTNNDVSR